MRRVSPRALISTSDACLGGMIANRLWEEAGIEAIFANTGRAALRCADEAEDEFSLVVLEADLRDWRHPGVERAVRRWKPPSAVVVLSEQPTEAAEIAVLDAGAVDYIPKASALSVLMARLRSRLREAARSQRARFPLGGKIFLPDRKALRDLETREEVILRDQEARLLHRLIAANGETVPVGELSSALWGDPQTANRHALHQSLHRLRKKLLKHFGPSCVLLREVGGYRIVVRDPSYPP